jgi:hypothetical protein
MAFGASSRVGPLVNRVVPITRFDPMDTNSSQPPPPSMVKLILWTLLWLVMWFFAIVGPFFVVLAVVSFFFDISGVVSMTLFSGEPVRTPQQKAEFLAVGALLGIIGIGFLWLRRRGILKDPL